MSLSREEMQLITQELAYFMGQETMHLIEAMECQCDAEMDLTKPLCEAETTTIICNRCKKLKELKGD